MIQVLKSSVEWWNLQNLVISFSPSDKHSIIWWCITWWGLEDKRKENVALYKPWFLNWSCISVKVCKFTNVQLRLLLISKSIFLSYNFMVKSIPVVFFRTTVATERTKYYYFIYLWNKLCPLQASLHNMHWFAVYKNTHTGLTTPCSLT